MKVCLCLGVLTHAGSQLKNQKPQRSQHYRILEIVTGVVLIIFLASVAFTIIKWCTPKSPVLTSWKKISSKSKDLPVGEKNLLFFDIYQLFLWGKTLIQAFKYWLWNYQIVKCSSMSWDLAAMNLKWRAKISATSLAPPHIVLYIKELWRVDLKLLLSLFVYPWINGRTILSFISKLR